MVAEDTGLRCDNWSVAYYGARHDLFTPADGAAGDVASGDARVRLLHVSHYSDQKNLGTLFRAIKILHQQEPGRYTLTITSNLANRAEEGSAALPRVLEELALFRELADLGVARDMCDTPYSELPDLYRSASMFVFPSYTESFGHPLVEAMAIGLPIIAADTPVNRDMCGDVASYHEAFSPEALADGIRRQADSGVLGPGANQIGMKRATGRFTWEKHVSVLCEALIGSE